ncbi:hypothetical protein [uncultured Methanobrevibacter sp.]|uniref:hypothetical protein n=1 Tax=uncultured Methanobrevibacter sp. TaxID=253161 RepID=UPI0025CF4466|nr:hypothetical protein [uncultured Methanobrevibacter sp.]
MASSKSIISVIIVIAVIAIIAFGYISANSHITKVDILSNSTLKNGDSVVIQLNDKYGNVYPKENIDVKILDDSGWANKYSVTTDSNGKASIKLTAFDNGNYTIHTNYNGTLFNKEYHGINSLKIDDGY